MSMTYYILGYAVIQDGAADAAFLASLILIFVQLMLLYLDLRTSLVETVIIIIVQSLPPATSIAAVIQSCTYDPGGMVVFMIRKKSARFSEISRQNTSHSNGPTFSSKIVRPIRAKRKQDIVANVCT